MCVSDCNCEIEGVNSFVIVQRALDQSSGDVGSSLAEPREQFLSCCFISVLVVS